MSWVFLSSSAKAILAEKLLTLLKKKQIFNLTIKVISLSALQVGFNIQQLLKAAEGPEELALPRLP